MVLPKKAMMPKRNEVQLGYSRDGFTLSRPTHRVVYGSESTEGAWNYGKYSSR